MERVYSKRRNYGDITSSCRNSLAVQGYFNLSAKNHFKLEKLVKMISGIVWCPSLPAAYQRFGSEIMMLYKHSLSSMWTFDINYTIN